MHKGFISILTKIHFLFVSLQTNFLKTKICYTMKKILTLSLVLCTILTQAQIFSEDFNAGIPATFTLTDLDGLTPSSANWSTGSFFANNLTTMGGVPRTAPKAFLGLILLVRLMIGWLLLQ